MGRACDFLALCRMRQISYLRLLLIAVTGLLFLAMPACQVDKFPGTFNFVTGDASVPVSLSRGARLTSFVNKA